MIDGTKISFFSTTIIADLLKLDVKVLTPLEEATGEIYFPKWAEYKHLTFKISKSNRVEIRGSLHKYWKGENHSDFTYGQLYECIADLSEKFNFKPSEARLHNLEFGVNVSPRFDPYEFCKALLSYRGDTFSKFRTNGKQKTTLGFECFKTQYSLKIYNKGRQYNLTENILRYEIKMGKMETLNTIGVYFLSDLTNTEVLKKLGKLLDDRFSELIISDTVNISDLSKNESRIYTQCKNPKEWEEFTVKLRAKRKKQYNEIIERFGQAHWRDITAKLINEKWRMLIAMKPLKSGNDLTDLKNSKRVSSDSLDNTSIHTHLSNSKKNCKTCGRDISEQKGNSSFCSAKYVGEKAAHKCRNMDSNKRNNIANREKKRYGGLNLFGLSPEISHDLLP